MVERILHLVAHVHVMSYPFWTAANLTDGAVTVQKVRLEGAHKHHPHVFNPSLSSYPILSSQPCKGPSTIVAQLLLAHNKK